GRHTTKRTGTTRGATSSWLKRWPTGTRTPPRKSGARSKKSKSTKVGTSSPPHSTGSTATHRAFTAYRPPKPGPVTTGTSNQHGCSPDFQSERVSGHSASVPSTPTGRDADRAGGSASRRQHPIAWFVLRRIAAGLLTLLVASFLIFAAVQI